MVASSVRLPRQSAHDLDRFDSLLAEALAIDTFAVSRGLRTGETSALGCCSREHHLRTGSLRKAVVHRLAFAETNRPAPGASVDNIPSLSDLDQFTVGHVCRHLPHEVHATAPAGTADHSRQRRRDRSFDRARDDERAPRSRPPPVGADRRRSPRPTTAHHVRQVPPSRRSPAVLTVAAHLHRPTASLPRPHGEPSSTRRRALVATWAVSKDQSPASVDHQW